MRLQCNMLWSNLICFKSLPLIYGLQYTENYYKKYCYTFEVMSATWKDLNSYNAKLINLILARQSRAWDWMNDKKSIFFWTKLNQNKLNWTAKECDQINELKQCSATTIKILVPTNKALGAFFKPKLIKSQQKRGTTPIPPTNMSCPLHNY